MTTTTTTLDTELSAVNSILGSIGQSPISQLDFTNPEVSFVYNLLKESNQDVQSEGWIFNKEYHIKNTNKIFIFFLQPAYALAILCKLCNAGHDICI